MKQDGRRTRWRRIRVWLPSLAALVFFLFHVETIGMFTDIIRRTTFYNNAYRITLPRHWIVQYAVESGGITFWAVAGKGVMRGWRDASWRWCWGPYAEIEGHSLADTGESFVTRLEHYCHDADITSMSTQKITGGEIECAEYRERVRRFVGAPKTLSDRFVSANCFAKGSDTILELTFYGTPEMLPEFYSFVRTGVHVR